MPSPAVAEREGFHERAARQAGRSWAGLDPAPDGRDPVDPRAATLLSAAAARSLRAVPFGLADGRLAVAFADPAAGDAIGAVRALTGLEVDDFASSPGAVRRAQDRVYGPAARPAALRPLRRTAAPRTIERLSRHAGLAWVSLDPADGADPVNPAAAQLLSEEQCRSLCALPISVRRNVLTVAVADPFDRVSIAVVQALTGRRPRLVVASAEEIGRAIGRVFAPLGAATVDQLLPGALMPPEQPRRAIGEILVGEGHVTQGDVTQALRIQRRVGSRLGEVLLHEGLIDERMLAAAIAAQSSLPVLDVHSFEPDPRALALVPEALARRNRFVPLAIRDHTLVLALSDALDDEAIRELRLHTDLPVRAVVTTRSSVETLLQRVYAERYTRIATVDLLNRAPEESAFRVVTTAQKIVLGALVLLGVLWLFYDPIQAIVVVNIASVLFYAAFSTYKFKLMNDAIRSRLELPVTQAEIEALDDRELPVYTILVPLYRETAVLGRLVESIGRLDYPRTKLDVKLLLEEDDLETIAAVRRMGLPAHFRTVIVPDAEPKTKPKACNYGLIQAEGEFVVIYDAEDRPEPDQLKKIVIAFGKAGPRVKCIQCKLNYFNREQNLLTRWFTSEYSTWFDLLMPGLDASDSPIPLGGTSNHFITDDLIALGAWDPFNVTEDADLGIRLHKSGGKTAIIDSTTYEEANSDLYNWIRQRSRWVKGYIQTWLVHMRHPVLLWRQVGWKSWLSFQLVIAGTFVGFLLNPFYWLLTTLWVLTQADVIRELFPGFVYFAAAVGLYLGNFVFMYVNVIGAMRRRYYGIVKYALLSPLYWALMSVAAWKGFLQLFYRPFYWEKTVHGLDAHHEPSDDGPALAPEAR